MKLRRSMALAAATAVIAPVVLLSAPAAFAEPNTTTPSETSSATPSETPSVTPSVTPSASESESASPTTPTATATATESASTSPETTASATPTQTATASASPTQSASASPTPTATEPEAPELTECEPRPLDLSINGLSGKIARGSGWHSFKFNVYNDSKSTVKNVVFFAGAAADKAGEHLFTTKQVSLQALNEEEGTWEDLKDLGTASGYVGETSEIKSGYEIDISLRIKVKESAPVGAGFSLGGGLVFGEDVDDPCFTDVAYKFRIVESGKEDGTKPQEGGKVPVPVEKPVAADTNQVTGALAETGSSSTTLMFALAGGAAVALGAGAMFIVRRRTNGAAAA